MNRHERRRQERAARKKRTPVLIAGEGIVAATLGQHFEATRHRELAPKEPGKHRWVATGAWVLSDQAVQDAYDPDRMKFLDNENLMYLGLGCWDCEQPLGQISYDSVCPAPADD